MRILKRLEDYRDIESINAFHEFTENGIMNEEEMLDALKAVSRDNARTPMQWDDSANAGFTTGTPWIKVNPNYLMINASRLWKTRTVFFTTIRTDPSAQRAGDHCGGNL